MNTVFLSRTRRLAAKAVVGMFVLVALMCVVTPLTAFACDGNNNNNNNNNNDIPGGAINALTALSDSIGGAVLNRSRSASVNSRTDNVVEPKFGHRHSNTNAHPCTDTWVKGSFDPPTNTTFYTLTIGTAPAFCEKVTWNFSSRTVGQDCTFFIKNLGQRFSLKVIGSSGQQTASVSMSGNAMDQWQANNVKQVQLDFSNLSGWSLASGGKRALTLGGIWYNC